jgi:hypothetical protein
MKIFKVPSVNNPLPFLSLFLFLFCLKKFILNFVGADFKAKVIEATGADGRLKRVKITIWDTGSAHNLFISPSLILPKLDKKDSEH